MGSFWTSGTQWCFPVWKNSSETPSTLSPSYQTALEGFSIWVLICMQEAGFNSQTLQSELATGTEDPNWFQCQKQYFSLMAEGSHWNYRKLDIWVGFFLRTVINTWTRWFILIHWKRMEAEQKSQKYINLSHYKFFG